MRNQEGTAIYAQPNICLHYVPLCNKPACYVLYCKCCTSYMKKEKKRITHDTIIVQKPLSLVQSETRNVNTFM